jgi:hypothetical protein
VYGSIRLLVVLCFSLLGKLLLLREMAVEPVDSFTHCFCCSSFWTDAVANQLFAVVGEIVVASGRWLSSLLYGSIRLLVVLCFSDAVVADRGIVAAFGDGCRACCLDSFTRLVDMI